MFKQTSFKILFLVFVSFGFLSLFYGAIPTFAADNNARTGLVVTPALYELEAERGNGYDIEINLLNDSGDDDYKITTLLQGFSASKEEGVPVVSDLASDSKYLSWVTFQQTNFSIKSNEKKVSHIRVNIPQDAEPGSHYLALTYNIDNPNQTPDPSKPQVKIQPRIAVMLFLNIKGQVQRDANFDFIQADKNLYDPFFDGAKIEYRIRAEGNAYLKPTGNIFIGGDSVNTKQAFWSYSNTTLNLNPEGKIILPNSARTFKLFLGAQNEVPYLSTGIVEKQDLEQNQSGNYTGGVYNLDHPWFGSQNVEVRMLFVNSQNELTQRSATVQLNYFPWKGLLLISPVLILLGVGFWFYRRKRRK